MLLVAEPILGDEEKAALSAVVDCGWITMGERVRDFERAFAAKHGAADAVAVSSCTAALHLIVAGLGIGPGDEVLVPSLTFVATVNSVLYVGATPVFVDIEGLDVPLMSVDDAAAKCTAKTRAVILMHYAGYLADRDIWRDFAAQRGLLLIEDAAHALGADQAGSFGQAAAFSLYGNKNMTTAEGGVVLASSKELLDTIRQMRSHGMTSNTFERLSSGTISYDVTMLGYNYRMDELRAAVGLTQLQHLSSWNTKRKTLTNTYIQLLKARCPNVGLPFLESSLPSLCQRTSSHHIMPVILPHGTDRRQLVDRLRAAGIQTTSHYPAAHRFSFYRRRFPSVHLPQTEEFARRQLTLPLHPRMTESQVDAVTTALADVLELTSRRQGALL
jgi:dTDP-4-amino-4,6-dideoxygalactose transaminase